MTPIKWMTARLLRTLNKDEQEAVRGDLEELQLTPRAELREVGGLVLRRQAALWKHWRPWIALLVLLTGGSLVSETAMGIIRHFVQVGITWWTHGVRYESAMSPGEEFTVMLGRCLALLFWGWGCGFVVGHLARRTPSLFVAGLLISLLTWLQLGKWALIFLPLMILLLLPVFRGIRDGARARVPHLAFFVTAILLFTALNLWTAGWYDAALVRWSEGAIQPRGGYWKLWRFAAMSWPVVYLLTMARRKEARTA